MKTRDYAPGERWDELTVLQKHYADFPTFLHDVITGLLGFTCSELQLDIAEFLEHGPKYRMIQAQRGQAKTTITACYAVWRLIHNPSTRVLIISAGGDMATEVAGWIIQIIKGMEELECMRPGDDDRSSVKAFDVHRELKGPEKSPSVACIGITASMQGRRADLLIADDVESSKNSMTETQRERLRHLTRDFTSICRTGDIVYLGTPQTVDSVYNSLASRGYTIRIWPGRYPTVEEEKNYGPWLAPSIRTKMELEPDLRIGGGPTGERGQPTDPVLMGEDDLTDKEIDQGAAYFTLQYMLSTKLLDADRFPLKSENIVFMRVPARSVPIIINFSQSEANRVIMPNDWPIEEDYYRAESFGDEFADFIETHMFVDPAGGGQNGDETAYAVTRFAAGSVFLVDAGGVPGGLDEASLDALTAIADKWKPHQIDVEKNFGNGALASVWMPKLLKKHKCSIEEPWSSGQKELRIIDTLEPIIGANRLIIDERLLQADLASTEKYPVEKRSSYSLFYQLSRITRDRGALLHDDRLEAVAGSCGHWTDHLRQDKHKAVTKARADNWRQMMKNPLGNGRPVPGWEAMQVGKSTRLGMHGGVGSTRTRNLQNLRKFRSVR